ncbi:MAG TPA: hypothetical protein VJ721_00880 [Chthoniobacterales bacterium]|nr:hypothetical protein [Chthoniobacterales bacterium]
MDQIHLGYGRGSKPGKRSHGESFAPSENSLCNSDNDKHIAAGKLSLRMADCGNALRPRFPNRHKPVAIPVRAAQFGDGQLAIGRANEPIHAATSGLSHPEARYLTPASYQP